jgi:ubiquinone/menaquinone biosynthesis C-methylase UbiE
MYNLEKQKFTKQELKLAQILNCTKCKKLLDISCGNGNELSFLKKHYPHLEYYGVDMQEKAVKQASQLQWANVSQALADDLPFGGNEFDVLISFMALHHYKNPFAVFLEASRVLKKEGKFFVADFLPKFKLTQLLHNWDKCDEPYHFEKYYTKKEVIKLAQVNNLTFIEKYKHPINSSINILLFKKTN